MSSVTKSNVCCKREKKSMFHCLICIDQLQSWSILEIISLSLTVLTLKPTEPVHLEAFCKKEVTGIELEEAAMSSCWLAFILPVTCKVPIHELQQHRREERFVL